MGARATRGSGRRLRAFAASLLLLVWGAACATGEGVGESAVLTAATADGVHVVRLALPAGGLPFNAPFELELHVARADGTPLADDVQLLPSGWMPDHGHGLVQHPRAEALGEGRFRAHGWLLHMRGRWELRVDVLRAADVAPGPGRPRANELARATFEVWLP